MRKQRRGRPAGDTLGQAKTGTAAGGPSLAMRRSLRGSAVGTEAEIPSFAAATEAAPRHRAAAAYLSILSSTISRVPATILLNRMADKLFSGCSIRNWSTLHVAPSIRRDTHTGFITIGKKAGATGIG